MPCDPGVNSGRRQTAAWPSSSKCHAAFDRAIIMTTKDFRRQIKCHIWFVDICQHESDRSIERKIITTKEKGKTIRVTRVSHTQGNQFQAGEWKNMIWKSNWHQTFCLTNELGENECFPYTSLSDGSEWKKKNSSQCDNTLCVCLDRFPYMALLLYIVELSWQQR